MFYYKKYGFTPLEKNSAFRRQRFLTGFTLIELSVVIAIITILATISIPNVIRYLAKARDAKRISDIQVLALAFESFYDDNGHYPGSSDDTNIGSGGDCIGVVGRTIPSGTQCSDGFYAGTYRNDGAVDALLRQYIYGPVPRDPLFDNNPRDYFYSYDPSHDYFMPLSVDWSVDPPTCVPTIYPNSNPGNPDLDNRTAVLAINKFETNTVGRHRDTCSGVDLNINNADYNIAFSEIGFGNKITGVP